MAAGSDDWAERGNAGWGCPGVLPYFRRSARMIGNGEDEYQGREGGLPVTSANTMATALTIGEKAADLVAGRDRAA